MIDATMSSRSVNFTYAVRESRGIQLLGLVPNPTLRCNDFNRAADGYPPSTKYISTMEQPADPHEHQRHIIRVLSTAQVLNGIGTTGTVAAGSLLVSSITHSTALAGLAQTTSVLGAAAMALPLARLTQLGGRRLALSTGYGVGVLGALFAITGGSQRILPLVLLGTLMVGAASAAGYQARFAAIDLATDTSRSRNLSFVVWGSTIGAVTGPNLMQPSGHLALAIGLPRLVGPYMIAALTLFLAAGVTRI